MPWLTAADLSKSPWHVEVHLVAPQRAPNTCGWLSRPAKSTCNCGGCLGCNTSRLLQVRTALRCLLVAVQLNLVLCIFDGRNRLGLGCKETVNADGSLCFGAPPESECRRRIVKLNASGWSESGSTKANGNRKEDATVRGSLFNE